MEIYLTYKSELQLSRLLKYLFVSIGLLTVLLFAGFGNFTAILLFPLLMYHFGLGVSGAAISTVISQYVPLVSAFTFFFCYLFFLIVVFLNKLIDLTFYLFQIHRDLCNDLIFE